MKYFKKILYVNTSAAERDSMAARAAALAKIYKAELTAVDVIPERTIWAVAESLDGKQTSFYLQEAIISERHSALKSMFEPYTQDLSIRTEVLVGKTFLEVIRTVLKDGYDLVIKPAENPDWTQRLFGSDDLHLLRKCPCPVWIINPSEEFSWKHIMAAVDFDPRHPSSQEHSLNREILEYAASLALFESATLHLVHAWEALGESLLQLRADVSSEAVAEYLEKDLDRHRKVLYRLAEELPQWIGSDAYDKLSLSFHLPKGPAEKVIPPTAAKLGADLVVMGTIARTGISGLIIGNTAEAILDQLTSSVLAIKPPGFKTPVQRGS
ncbi:MAG: universal stress protein [Desulfohalobiaceae bacterium]